MMQRLSAGAKRTSVTPLTDPFSSVVGVSPAMLVLLLRRAAGAVAWVWVRPGAGQSVRGECKGLANRGGGGALASQRRAAS